MKWSTKNVKSEYVPAIVYSHTKAYICHNVRDMGMHGCVCEERRTYSLQGGQRRKTRVWVSTLATGYMSWSINVCSTLIYTFIHSVWCSQVRTTKNKTCKRLFISWKTDTWVWRVNFYRIAYWTANILTKYFNFFLLRFWVFVSNEHTDW